MRSDDTGRFTVAAVLPGDYRVFAFPLPASPMESDPEFRSQFLDQSTVLHVEPGVPKTIDLRAISKK